MNGKQARRIRKDIDYDIAADRSSAEYRQANGAQVRHPNFYVSPKTFFRASREAEVYKQLKRAHTRNC